MTETFPFTATELKRVYHNNTRAYKKFKLAQLARAPFYITREVTRIDFSETKNKQGTILDSKHFIFRPIDAWGTKWAWFVCVDLGGSFRGNAGSIPKASGLCDPQWVLASEFGEYFS